jgi:hypothetical protein
MVVLTPPAVPRYIPQTQAIAFVAVQVTSQASPQGPRTHVMITLLDASGVPLAHDRSVIRAMTPEELETFESAPAHAGDSQTQDICRRILPYLKSAYELDGSVQ